MSNSFGSKFRISTFGESHGKAIGVTVDGCPAGIEVDEEFIQSELARRKPGQSKITTQRKEDDEFQILSGVFEGKTTGAPLAMISASSSRCIGKTSLESIRCKGGCLCVPSRSIENRQTLY